MHNLRKKLIYVSQHRGTKEADVIVGRFVASIIDELPDQKLSLLHDFLQIADATLMDWAMKRGKPGVEEETEIVHKFLIFCNGH